LVKALVEGALMGQMIRWELWSKDGSNVKMRDLMKLHRRSQEEGGKVEGL